jgi:hypothetical protein
VISAAVVGLGRWGRNLVECTQGKTDKIRFTTAVVRSPDKARDFARAQDLALVTDYAKALAICGVAVLEAIVASARSGRRENIE